ncbi:Stemmadenine O-acetyltransferase-like protein [Drosera capensis]
MSQVPKSFMAIGCVTLPTYASMDLSNENDQRLDVLVGRVHEAVARVDEEYVKKYEGEEATDRIWCNLGGEEIDFGWGKPVWVCPCGEPPTLLDRYTFILMDVDNGKGIEVWCIVQEEGMARLKCDHEFLEFATPISGVYGLTA